MTSCDEKSAFDNIKLHDSSRTFFGIQFAGWYMVFTVLPFGFKASPFIYQTVGLLPTTFLRSRGIPTTLYLDDHFVTEWQPSQGAGSDIHPSSEMKARYSIFCLCHVLLRLGYTISLVKSVFCAVTRLRHLGFIVDSQRQVFMVPEDKRLSFGVLRNEILSSQTVGIKTLQRFQGKCISFLLCVPGARLFVRAIARAISCASKGCMPIRITGELREEIAHWAFLDAFSDWIPWRSERHIAVTVCTDSSGFRWGATINGDSLGDYWEMGDNRPIHLKEASALISALHALSSKIRNTRVDARVDNQAVVASWGIEGSRDPNLNRLMKELFSITCALNIDLKVTYISTHENPADEPSRALSPQDAMLGRMLWQSVEEKWGPHTVDMMALDSNAMKNANGDTLRHFTPCPLPMSAGVNVFCQVLSPSENYYVFPPFCLIFSLFGFLKEYTGSNLQCTMVVPRCHPLPPWWPVLVNKAIDMQFLAAAGTEGALLFPSKSGWATRPLVYDFYGFRFKF